MTSATDYFPGALSEFLTGDGSNAAVVSKKRKRKKQVESGDETNVLFKKRVTCSKPVELPVGEEKLQPKLIRSIETDDLKSGTSFEGPNSEQSVEQKNLKIMTMEEKTRTVFVGNAPLSSTRKEIKKLFSQFGPVESVRLRSVIAADEKTSKRVAVLKRDISNKMKSLTFYVKFKDAKSVEGALTLNGEKYGENLLRVDGCCGQRRYSSQTTVFVGNLPYDVSENELTAHFETCGSVSFVRIVRDPKTGNGRGFAFVAFKENAAVPLALQLNGSTFKNRQLRVTKVQKRNKMKGKTYQRTSRNATQRSHKQLGNKPKNVPKKKARKAGKKKRVKNSVMT